MPPERRADEPADERERAGGERERAARGPTAALAVGAEALRALGALALAPPRALTYLARRPRLVAELAADMDAPAAPAELPAPGPLPARPLRIFVSCAEPSGEVLALQLVAALRSELGARGAAEAELVGLGGARLAAAGVRLIGEPVSRAAMGADALRALPYYLRLLRDAAEELRSARPDLLIAVDSPALHVPLGGLARRYGVPVAHLATPQYWAWAPWRVGGYRRAVDLALTILPFEPAWFARHGVRAAHVGHPLLDSLRAVERSSGTDEPLLALLPGSRESVVRRNLPWMIVAAARLRAEVRGLEVALPHDRPELGPLMAEIVARSGARGWIRLELGGLHATLARARAALSVSGTVLIDLLHHRLPAVVVYRLRSSLAARLAPHALSVPWFSSVNLLAGREVYPEFVFAGAGPLEDVGRALARCYNDADHRASCRAGLEEAARRLGPAGATARAARLALTLVEPPCTPPPRARKDSRNSP